MKKFVHFSFYIFKIEWARKRIFVGLFISNFPFRNLRPYVLTCQASEGGAVAVAVTAVVDIINAVGVVVGTGSSGAEVHGPRVVCLMIRAELSRDLVTGCRHQSPSSSSSPHRQARHPAAAAAVAATLDPAHFLLEGVGGRGGALELFRDGREEDDVDDGTQFAG